MSMNDAPIVEVKSRSELRTWLEKNHATKGGVWLASYKKSGGSLYLPWDDIVEELLCFGWIDSVARKLDDQRSMLYICPRKPGSVWSALNKKRLAKLEEEGIITASGWAVIDRAKADGSWSSIDSAEAGEEPPDLTLALDSEPKAREHWNALAFSARRGVLTWLISAKTEKTRSARIAQIVAQCERGEKPLGSMGAKGQSTSDQP
jgi:uncharacterized protein YdeI (YjbR/CyaY-like superfamily)